MAISSGINLVMTVIGFAVSTMFIVFVCTRLICARIQLRASRRNFPTASRSDLSILERGLHGLEPVVVASFPTKEFGEHFSSGQDTHSTTFQIVNSLRQYIHIFSVTAVISLLQPVPETYDLFDDIILLSDGLVVYQGPRENVLEFLSTWASNAQKEKGLQTSCKRCTVCLAEYQERDILRILPYCRHAFHISCIDIWLKQHSTCPVCRISLRDSPDRSRTMQPAFSGPLYPRETFELDFHHCLYSNLDYSEMIENNQRAGSIQEDRRNSEPSGVDEVPSPHETKAKYMESPSNA